MTLQELKDSWIDTPEFHERVNELFTEKVDQDEILKRHRDWVTSNAFGFGEKSFHYMWSLLVNEMPKGFSFIEIGVFRGQVLSLISLVSDLSFRKPTRYGVTPLDSSDNHWTSDYKKDIEIIHDKFDLPKDYFIYHGSSTDNKIIKQASKTAPYDIVYIDGSHVYKDVVSDLINYAPMVKEGGYLVIDDACNDMDMPFGFFQGIAPVTQAVLEWENDKFEFQFNVVHLRVYKRVK